MTNCLRNLEGWRVLELHTLQLSKQTIQERVGGPLKREPVETEVCCFQANFFQDDFFQDGFGLSASRDQRKGVLYHRRLYTPHSWIHKRRVKLSSQIPI